MSNRHLFEEEMVDLVMGRLSPERILECQCHLSTCSSCREVYREWQKLLQQNSDACPPSVLLKKRMKSRFLLSHWIKRLRPLVVFPAAGCAMIFSLCMAWFLNEEPNTPGIIIDQERIQSAQLLSDPHTVHFEIAPVSSSVRGYVWLNDDSEEVLLLVKGMIPLEGHDYQVWFIDGQQRDDAGVFRLDNGVGRFYFQGESIKKAENIAVTIEPQGGSRNPTGPDTIFIHLRKQ